MRQCFCFKLIHDIYYLFLHKFSIHAFLDISGNYLIDFDEAIISRDNLKNETKIDDEGETDKYIALNLSGKTEMAKE